jgi:hypothetical protein
MSRAVKTYILVKEVRKVVCWAHPSCDELSASPYTQLKVDAIVNFRIYANSDRPNGSSLGTHRSAGIGTDREG